MFMYGELKIDFVETFEQETYHRSKGFELVWGRKEDPIYPI